jgi:hypothetical protein
MPLKKMPGVQPTMSGKAYLQNSANTYSQDHVVGYGLASHHLRSSQPTPGLVFEIIESMIREEGYLIIYEHLRFM